MSLGTQCPKSSSFDDLRRSFDLHQLHQLSGERRSESDYLSDDAHSVTTGSGFITRFIPDFFCFFQFSFLKVSFFKRESSALSLFHPKVSMKSTRCYNPLLATGVTAHYSLQDR
jgi:hypothetical protein